MSSETAEVKARTSDIPSSAPISVLKGCPTGIFSRYHAWRKSFGLPNPGAFEQLHKEVRGVFATAFLFDGAKFDFSKVLSQNFNVVHSISLGSQVAPSSYNFGATFADQKFFLNGLIDHEGSLQGRGSYSLTSRLTSKFQIQIGTAPGMGMTQLELDYSGIDYTLNAKAINISPVDFTGIYVASYLQSIFKPLAVGCEVAYQRPVEGVAAPQLSFVGKYTGKNWSLTTNVSQIGVIQTSYWQRVSETIELGGEVQLFAAQNRREGVCTVGGKWEFRQATFRGQVDTAGRVAAALEERLAAGFSILFTGDLDHMKGQSKFGIGLQLEN